MNSRHEKKRDLLLPATPAAAGPQGPGSGTLRGTAPAGDRGLRPGTAGAGRANRPEAAGSGTAAAAGGGLWVCGASPVRAGPQAGRRRPLPVPAAEGSVSPGPAAGRGLLSGGGPSAAKGPPRRRRARGQGLLGGGGKAAATSSPPPPPY